MMTKEKRKKLKRNSFRVFACIAATVIIILAILQGGMFIAHLWKPYVPDYDKTDITSILEKSELTEEDYETLYRQTGLTRLGVDGLIAKEEKETIFEIQEDFFAGYEMESNEFAPFVCWEKLSSSKSVHLAAMEDGDIFISPSTHFSFVRFGHAALVVDGENKQFLNAVGYGSPSAIVGAGNMRTRAAFMILRPKADESVRKEVAAYAKENLVNIDYSIIGGVFGGKYVEPLPLKTQCSHVVWYAYKHFDIDLDSNGGLIVTPKNIARSPELQLVQAYGFDLDKLW